MQLDIRSLIFVIAVISSIASLVLFLVHRFRYSVSGTSAWALGYVIMTISFFLLSFRELTPVFFSISIANTSVVLSLGLIYSGFRQFVGKPGLFKYHLTIPLFFLPAFYWYSEVEDSLLIRIIFVSSAIVIYSLLISLELWRYKGKRNLPAVFLTAFVYFINALVFSLRIITSWIQGINGPFLQTGFQTVLLFLYYIFMVLFSTFGKIMMISEKLENTVASKTEDLEAANQRLEAFNYTLSHDIKSPLNLIREYCQILEEQLKDDPSPERKQICQKIGNYSGRAMAIVSDILRFSRITPANLNKINFDLAPVFDQALELYKESYPKLNIKVKREQSIPVFGDRELLKLVIENLLHNAIKYSSSRETISLVFSVIKDNNGQVIFLKDNGIGFNSEDTERMFLPFARIHHEDEKSGSGIGLSTVSRIIELHGGRVWAEGKPGQGAVFYFTVDSD